MQGSFHEQRAHQIRAALGKLHEGLQSFRAKCFSLIALLLDVRNARGNLLRGQRLLFVELVNEFVGLPAPSQQTGVSSLERRTFCIYLFQVGSKLLAQVIDIGLASFLST